MAFALFIVKWWYMQAVVYLSENGGKFVNKHICGFSSYISSHIIALCCLCMCVYSVYCLGFILGSFNGPILDTGVREYQMSCTYLDDRCKGLNLK